MTNDLISREALKKAIMFKDNANAETWEQLYDSVLEEIDNAPTVHHPNCDICEDKAKQYSLGFQDGYLTGKERPQGEWIEKVKRRGCFAGDKTVYSYTCPFCGVTEFKKYPFCHCGAEMKGGKEE